MAEAWNWQGYGSPRGEAVCTGHNNNRGIRGATARVLTSLEKLISGESSVRFQNIGAWLFRSIKREITGRVLNKMFKDVYLGTNNMRGEKHFDRPKKKKIIFIIETDYSVMREIVHSHSLFLSHYMITRSLILCFAYCLRHF